LDALRNLDRRDLGAAKPIRQPTKNDNDTLVNHHSSADAS
jgi:hypothetical protein